MMIKRLCLLPLVAFATVNEPFRVEWQTGYRNDNLHWYLKSAGENSQVFVDERFNNLQFWENALCLSMIYRDLAFYAWGDYAAFGRGELNQQYENQSYATDNPSFNFSVHGWAADWDTYFGLAVDLMAGRTYKFLVIPLVGYSGNYEMIHQPGTQTFSSSNAVGASSYQVQSTLPTTLYQSWNGVYLGLGVRFEPGSRLLLDAGYAYHWIHLNLTTQFQQDISLFSPNSQSIQLNEINSSSGGNHGHSGWAQMDYIVDKKWRIGARATIQYYFTNVVPVTQNQTTTPVTPAGAVQTSAIEQNLKFRWTPVAALFTISREI